jgi:hypothetical protein
MVFGNNKFGRSEAQFCREVGELVFKGISLENKVNLDWIKLSQRCAFDASDIIGMESNNNIVVYQAFGHDIADYALSHQKLGGESFSFSRMSWIKTSFLWMMYRSGWGKKTGQERVLAIEIHKHFFIQLVSEAYSTRYAIGLNESLKETRPEILVQLDPDRDIEFRPLNRRAIQIGIRGRMLRQYAEEMILNINDLTPIVETNFKNISQSNFDEIIVPNEKKLERISELAVRFMNRQTRDL